MDSRIDKYLLDGCMRCSLGGTPGCKVNTWREELKALMAIVLDCGLEEDLKWGVPCYTYRGKNVAIIAAFKDYASLSFFKGSLLRDEAHLLHKPGESSQAARLFKFTSVSQIMDLETYIKSYVFEAMELEKLGMKVDFAQQPEAIPSELISMFELKPEFKLAFESLTPGRQRGYLIHFNQAKQSATRTARIEKYIEKIMAGKGIMD